MDLDNREVIINLADLDALIEKQNKDLLALFVEVDGELVDVLVYAVREHFAVIPYKAQRTIKFTLRDIFRHEKVGDARLKMGLLSNFNDALEQTVYLDGQEKYRIGENVANDKPFAKLIYEWKDPDAEPETEQYTGDGYIVSESTRDEIELEKRMRQSETDLQYVIRDLIEGLKRDAKDTDTENTAKTQELENQLLQLIQINEFSEQTTKQSTTTQSIFESVQEFSKTEGDSMRTDTENVNSEIRELELQIRAMDDEIS
jgi:hypothetical protein